MKIEDFKSFNELISTPVDDCKYRQAKELIDDIYNKSLDNQVWISVILSYLNNGNEENYNEYYLTPDLSYGTRKYAYRFISKEEDMPNSITDSDVEVLRKLNAQTKFILYDYQEIVSSHIFDYLKYKRTLKEVINSIGMSEEVKNHLCEYCFNRVKRENEVILRKSVLSRENIELLFEDNDFDYILKLIDKCEEGLDAELLGFISKKAQELLSDPNANIWSKEKLIDLIKKYGVVPGNINSMDYDKLVDFYNRCIVEACEKILFKIICVCCDNYECFGNILEQLYENESENVRAYCCARADYKRFVNDSSSKVVKIMNIRQEFDKKWDELDEDDVERQRIEFLISECNKGHIGHINYDVLIVGEEDKSRIKFTSFLFESSEDIIFDSDILYKIRDIRILADRINELIKMGYIVLKDDLVPECFKSNIVKKLV